MNSRRNRLSARLREDWIIDGYALDGHTVDRLHGLIQKHRPVALYGFTSMLEFAARETLRRGLQMAAGSVCAAWNGGEMLFASQGELFRQAFGAPLANLYGSRELGAMAYQNTGADRLQPLRPLLFAEILDEHGRPAAAGEVGRLVWTSTFCRGTPFLRYDCGDLACYDAQDADESGVRSIRQLHGRSAGLLRLADGRTVNCIFWNHLLKEYAGIEQFQVGVLETGGFELRLKGTGFSQSDEGQVRKALAAMFGDTALEIRWLPEIPLTSQGKLEQVVRL